MNRQQRVAHVVALVVIGVCGLAVPALAQDCPELVGRMPGPITAVAVSGGYAYLANEGGLLVADVSDSSVPRLVGEVGLQGTAQDIAVSDDYVYLAADSAGLRLIDVSVPSAPVEVGSIDSTELHAWGVAVSGGYAYVTGSRRSGSFWEGGLAVIDVSVPSTPLEVGFVWMPGGAGSVAVSGDHAFVTDDEGLRVIDISIPSVPVEVAFLETPASDVVVSGDHAFVTGREGLRVIDVTTPASPVEVGFIDTPWGVSDVAVSGDYAYVAEGPYDANPGGLRVIDVSVASAPVEVGLLEGAADNVEVSGGHAYVACGGACSLAPENGGFRVIDVSTPSAPLEVGSITTYAVAGFAVSGGYAYVAADDAGFQVIDVSTPSAPVEVGFIHPPDSAWDVAVEGGYAYVVSGWSVSGYSYSVLSVIDVSTPSAPAAVGLLEGVGGGAFTVADGYVYVCAGSSGLLVIDATTPASPVEVGFIDTPWFARDVAVDGGHAYVADDRGGLRVIDVSVPSAPVEVSSVDTPWSANGVAVSGSYAYVTWRGLSSPGGLRVIDVSNPLAPVEVGFVDTLRDPLGVAVSGGYAYVPSYFSNAGLNEPVLSVIDVSTPSTPVETGSFSTASRGLGNAAVSGGFVYLGALDAGLFIFNECTREVIPDVYDSFIPAAAVAAGAEGAFFQTDVELNNNGAAEAEVHLQWLPRGEDNSEPVSSDLFTLAAGASLRFDNVLTEVFGLEPDSLGALKMVASTDSVIGMSRTYNSPGGKAAGTFGQGLPAVRATEMIAGTAPQRIVFLSEDPDSRANIGCVNGSSQPVSINIGIFDDEGSPLETTTMDLGPWSNDQINRVFEDWAPVNGYVDVWGDSEDALFTCYGSILDNLTSDPTTILPQVASSDTIFIPAAALAAGLEGAFFTTDVDLNNVGSDDITYEFLWLPRGADNSEPVRSETFSLAAGSGVRYANVLGEVFGLEPDQVGALEIQASGIGLLAMSRTYNTPPGDAAGTFGQGLPGVPADRMIPTGVRKRIVFMSEDDDFRANLGCVNGVDAGVAVAIELHDSEGVALETKYMLLPPYSNLQINGIFQDYAPMNGYVEVRTNTPAAWIYCYGSVLDNLTSDPTTVLPQ